MSTLDAKLLEWIADQTGTKAVEVRELTGGASRNSYVVTGADGARVFLRLDAGHGPLSGTPFTLAREYAVLSQLQAHSLPIPRVRAFSAELNAALMEFIPGHTSYDRIGDPAEETRLYRELMRSVVALQQVDPKTVPALGAPRGATVGAAIRADLELWQRMYAERVKLRDPLVDFSLNWLSRAVPDAAQPCVIVHGDVGPGNFLIVDGEIVAVIDWEMVRLGHPFEDVACIIARALGAPFGTPREHIENYQQLTGTTVDYSRLDYALALVLSRWMVGILMALSRPSALQNVPMLFAFRQIDGLALIEALCRLNDIPAESSPPAQFRGADPCRAVFAWGGDTLAQLAASEGLAATSRYKLDGVADMLTYLQAFIDYGPERYEREDCERIATLIGRAPRDAADANAAICDYAREVGTEDSRGLLEYLLWRGQREQAVMRLALGERGNNRIRYG
jgi:aminoglycoside phosphotransferase (APT) family kinase protein